MKVPTMAPLEVQFPHVQSENLFRIALQYIQHLHLTLPVCGV
jgi:hypothetical protein